MYRKTECNTSTYDTEQRADEFGSFPPSAAKRSISRSVPSVAKSILVHAQNGMVPAAFPGRAQILIVTHESLKRLHVLEPIVRHNQSRAECVNVSRWLPQLYTASEFSGSTTRSRVYGSTAGGTLYSPVQVRGIALNICS